MLLFPSKPKRPAQALFGRLLLGFGVGGVAAACGAIAFFRVRTRSRFPVRDALGASSAPEGAPSVPKDWSARGSSLDSLVPASYSIPDADPTLAAEAAVHPDPSTLAASESGSAAESEAWMEPLRSAMEGNPFVFGYGKSVWTAPLLVRYLSDSQGVTVPVPQLRRALKRMGYSWKHTRYVKDRSGNDREDRSRRGRHPA